MFRKDDFVVVLTALNEAAVIGDVLESIKIEGYKNIVLVDDGSGDTTGDIGKQMSATVIKHSINLGAGAGYRTALDYVKIHYKDTKYAIRMDADGQHEVSDLNKVAAFASENDYELVMGSRVFEDPKIPFFKKEINFLADILTYFLSGKYIKDSMSGMKCLKINRLGDLHLTARDYAIENEIIIKACRNKWNIATVNIPARYTDYSTKKPIRLRFMSIFTLVIKLLSI